MRIRKGSKKTLQLKGADSTYVEIHWVPSLQMKSSLLRSSLPEPSQQTVRTGKRSNDVIVYIDTYY